MTAFEKEGTTSSLKQKSERKRKLSDRDHWTLTWIVKKNYKNTAPKITPGFYDHFENPVSSKTIRQNRISLEGPNPKTILNKIYLQFSDYCPHLCRHVYHNVSVIVRSGLLQVVGMSNLILYFAYRGRQF